MIYVIITSIWQLYECSEAVMPIMWLCQFRASQWGEQMQQQFTDDTKHVRLCFLPLACSCHRVQQYSMFKNIQCKIVVYRMYICYNTSDTTQ